MEFGCKVAGAKLIMVLGHSKCGAVKGACDHVEMGNLTALLSKIQPAVYHERTVTKNRNSDNSEFVEKVAVINVKKTMCAIMERSPILRDLIESGAICIIGGMHNITTGEVEFFQESSKNQRKKGTHDYSQFKAVRRLGPSTHHPAGSKF